MWAYLYPKFLRRSGSLPTRSPLVARREPVDTAGQKLTLALNP